MDRYNLQPDISSSTLVLRPIQFNIFLQIEIGMAFYYVVSRLEIYINSATNLRRANMHNDQSDPFVKVKVFRKTGDGNGKSPKWKFQTKTVWKTLFPVWKEQ